MKIIRTRYGQITAQGVFTYLILFAVVLYAGYQRNRDLHRGGGLVFLLVLSVFVAWIVWLILIEPYEITVLGQGEQIKHQTQEIENLTGSEHRERERKHALIEKYGDHLSYILDTRERGPFGLSHEQVREMVFLNKNGMSVENIAKALEKEPDAIEFLLAALALRQNPSNYGEAWNAGSNAYERLLGKGRAE